MTDDTPTTDDPADVQLPDADLVVLGLLRDAHAPGDQLEYGNLQLQRLDTTTPLWLVAHTGQYVDVIAPAQFRSVMGLRTHLERACGALEAAEDLFETGGAGQEAEP